MQSGLSGRACKSQGHAVSQRNLPLCLRKQIPRERGDILSNNIKEFGQLRERSVHRWQAAAQVKDEEQEDSLLWDSVPEPLTAGVSDPDSDGRQSLDSKHLLKNGSRQGSESSDESSGWDGGLSREEQASLDDEAREFAYSFGGNEARDVVSEQSKANSEDLEEDTVPQKTTGRESKVKGRKRNERRSGRPRDSSIPLHMLPKVPDTFLSILNWHCTFQYIGILYSDSNK